MSLLDWIRQRDAAKQQHDPECDPKSHGHDSWKGVFNEIREDEALGKVRDETGREPERSDQKTIRRPRPSWER